MAADYYVATNGNDGNAGTLASPWKTISKGVSGLNAGDTLYVRGGTYVETNGVNVTRSGNASAPITVAAYPGETPVIDGQNMYPRGQWGALVSLIGFYIHMSGFEVKNSNADTGSASRGVTLWGNHNTISKFNVHDIQGNGVLIQGDYGTVEDCDVWRVCMENENNKLNGWGSGLSAARGSSYSAIPGITSYPIIRRCKLHNAWGEGLSLYETDHGIVEYNEVWDNYAVNMYISDASNTLVRGNIIYVTPNNGMLNGGGQWEGLALSNEVANGTTHPYSTNNIIVNNLFLNTSASLFSWWVIPIQGFKNGVFANNTIVNGRIAINSRELTHANSIIANNIVTGVTNPVSEATNNGVTWHHNLWPVAPPAAAAGAGDVINANAGLAKSGSTAVGQLTSAYFDLTASSPAIDKGTTLSARTADYYGHAFVGSPDMGAIEYAPAALPDVVVTSLTYDPSTGAFTSVIKNQGAGAVAAGVGIGVAYLVDGTQRTWGYSGLALAAGASVTIGSDGGTYAIPPGTHTVVAQADDTDRFLESNEINNTRSLSVTINQAPVAVAQSATTSQNTAKAITLVATDADGNALTYAIVANPGHGTLSGSGSARTYTPASNYSGADSFTFKVNDGMADSNTATVSITVTATNTAPAVGAVAATPMPVTGTTANLSATASDNGGEPSLVYTWTATGPAAVQFSANGTNAAKSAVATFAKAGSYALTVTAKDTGNLTGTKTLAVTVNATATRVTISPTSASVQPLKTVNFHATMEDQFGAALASQPTMLWAVTGSGGSIDANGQFTAGAGDGAVASTNTVTATGGGQSGTALVTVSTVSSTTAGNSGGCGIGAVGLVIGLGLMVVSLRRRR